MFDDIVENDVVVIRPNITVIATKPHKDEHGHGLRTIAWETQDGEHIITPENFLRFEGD